MEDHLQFAEESSPISQSVAVEHYRGLLRRNGTMVRMFNRSKSSSMMSGAHRYIPKVEFSEVVVTRGRIDNFYKDRIEIYGTQKELYAKL